MRGLRRNKRRLFYALYEGKEPIIDEWGNETGEWSINYGNPIECYKNYSAAKGEADVAVFGSDLQYDRVVYFGKPPSPVNEQSIFWVDIEPVIELDGSTLTPHDYVVARVADSLNEILVAVRRVSISR